MSVELDALLAADPELDPTKIVFLDPREGGSLRLTQTGYDLLKDKYPHWSEKLPDVMTVAHHTYFVAISTYPYFMHKGILTTFDPNLGVAMKMVGGDFEKLQRMMPRT